AKKHVRGQFKEPLHLERNIISDLSNWLAENRPELRKETLPAGEDPRPAYLSALAEQYATLSMIGFKRSFDMTSIYIPLTVHADPEAKIHCKPGKPDDVHDFEKIYSRTLKAEDLLTLPEKVAVVLGEPGMGKTTMLHYLALRESKIDNGLLPIFVKLADYSKSNEPLQTYLLASVEKHIIGSAMQQVAQKNIEQGKALILLDGLDEVSRDTYTKVTDCIRAFIAGHKECRVIITSRKAGFQSNEVPYLLFEIDKLPDAEIATLVKEWFKPEPTDLAQLITANERMHELAQNPFLLSIMCFIFEKDHDLPRRRVELYQKCTMTLLTLYDERQIPKVNAFSRNLKEAVLNDLVWHFFTKDLDEFPYASLTEQMAATLAKREQNVNEDHLLREICENSGLLQKSDDRYFFVHRTFFEYYVACKMREHSQSEALGFAEQAKWEEPLRLYAAQIKSVEEGTQFFENLWQQDTALALRCFADMDRVVEPELIKTLLGNAKVDERIELVKSLPEKISDDAKIVESLGELFNHETNGEVLYRGVQLLEERAAIPGAKNIVFNKLDAGAEQRYKKWIAKDMVRVPAGTFIMGSPENEEGRDDDEMQHEVTLDAFLCHKFAVTNALYERFDPEHKNRSNEYSDDDEQPVLYVNWYEASMFCRWLGCRLPTEAEWEYAAREGGKNVRFGNGKDIADPAEINFNASKTYKRSYSRVGEYRGKTTPVGTFPANAFGLYDMSGNVWEWCQDWYGKYEKSAQTNPQGLDKGENFF
ncbi:MAG: NACHT domain-containing protein, partial [Calditrichaeota bacterium]